MLMNLYLKVRMRNMCSLFGLIDFKECLSTHTKNKILNTLARECQVRGTDATGIAYNFNDRGSTNVHFPLGR